MAQNITTSVSSGMPGTSAGSSSRATADGITFGDEVERSSFLIIDQHTFEGKVLTSVAAQPSQVIMVNETDAKPIEYLQTNSFSPYGRLF